MMQEFITFVQKLFPSIDPYIASQVSVAIKQFERKRCQDDDVKRPLYDFFTTGSLGDYLAQGDIIDNLPFVLLDPETGEESFRELPGILLSNTCDAEREDYIIFAPLLPKYEMYKQLQDNFSTNLTYNLMYFPDTHFSEYVIDLSLMRSFPREPIVSSDAYRKIASLNDFGYYLLLCKLTVYFLRPEDTDVQIARVETA